MVFKGKNSLVWLSIIILWLLRAESFEVETPLPDIITLSQPFTFTWRRDQSDLLSVSAYIQFATTYSGTTATGSVIRVGESKSGTYTMTPREPGALTIDGWSGYSPNLDEDSRDRYFRILPHTFLVGTLQMSESSPTQSETSLSTATQTQEPPVQTPTEGESRGGRTSSSEQTSPPSSVFTSGSEAPPVSTGGLPAESKSSNRTGAITGGVVGALSAITIIVAMFFYIRRRKQLGKQHRQDAAARPLSPVNYLSTTQRLRHFGAEELTSMPGDQKLDNSPNRDVDPDEELPQLKARLQEMAQRVARLEAEIEMSPPTYASEGTGTNGRETQ
ncbi:hypothetical protein PM082_012541 [Marasmius tenuissimus]|nr:hypothetical protein PM082_012541 [Marasmius tenuissimus]